MRVRPHQGRTLEDNTRTTLFSEGKSAEISKLEFFWIEWSRSYIVLALSLSHLTTKLGNNGGEISEISSLQNIRQEQK